MKSNETTTIIICGYLAVSYSSHHILPFNSPAGFTTVSVCDLAMIMLGDLSCGVGSRLGFPSSVLGKLCGRNAQLAPIPSDFTCGSLNNLRLWADDAILPAIASVSVAIQTFVLSAKCGSSLNLYLYQVSLLPSFVELIQPPNSLRYDHLGINC